jgi:hypothetical protein
MENYCKCQTTDIFETLTAHYRKILHISLEHNFILKENKYHLLDCTFYDNKERYSTGYMFAVKYKKYRKGIEKYLNGNVHIFYILYVRWWA